MAEGGNTPVGGLEIEISTNATTAETAIKNLASAMEKLASVKFSNDGVAKIVGQLSSLNNVKISGTIATRLTEIGKSMDSVSDESINRLDRATAALQRLAGVDLKGVGNAFRASSGGFESQESSIEKQLRGAELQAYRMDRAIDSVENKLAKLASGKTYIDPGFLKNALEKISEFRGAEEEAVAKAEALRNALDKIRSGAIGATSEDVKQLRNELQAAQDRVRIAGEAAKNALAGVQPITGIGETRDFGEETDAVSRTLRDIDSKKTKIQVDSKEAKKAEKDVDSLKGKVSALSKVLNAFKRIAFYRAIRAAIKAVTDAFREGLNNLYQYSKVAGTSFAPAMDSAATSALYLKNSLGSAAGALLESLIPAITTLVDWLVEAVNWVNQLIRALGGNTTWYKPIKATKEYAQAANSAADAVKRWTMGIDELNIISKTSGSGGIISGPSASDYFEPAQIDENILNLADKLKELWPVIKTSLALLGGFWILKKIADLVGRLTGAFGRKNSALQTQNGLEEAASKELATGLVPSLLMAAAAAFGLDGALEGLKSPLGETVPAFEGVSAAAASMENSTSESMDGAIDAVRGYATETETAMETVRSATSNAETSLGNSYSKVGNALADLKNNVATNTESIREQTENTRVATESASNQIVESYGKVRDGIGETADSVRVGSGSIYNSSIVVGASKVFLDVFADALGLTGTKAETVGGLVESSFGAMNTAASSLDASGIKTFSDNMVTYFGNIFNAVWNVISAIRTLFQTTGTSTSSTATSSVSVGGSGRQKMMDEAFQKVKDAQREEKLQAVAQELAAQKLQEARKGLETFTSSVSVGGSGRQKMMDEAFQKVKDAQREEKLQAVAQELAAQKLQEARKGLETLRGYVNTAYEVRNRMDEALNGMADGWFDFWEGLNNWLDKNAPKITRNVGMGLAVGGGLGVPAFASGGFPTTGELFWARERGPELVGQIGNRTAVANNEQIVQGIAEGVEGANQGVINAIYGMANLIVNAIEQKDTDITLDGKRLVKYMAAENKRAGTSLVKVGV